LIPSFEIDGDGVQDEVLWIESAIDYKGIKKVPETEQVFADFDGDGSVGFGDFLILSDAY